MAKMTRREHEGAQHHAYGRGNRKQAIFLDDTDCQEFLRRLLQYKDQHGIELLAYCLMINHYHLALESAKGEISEFMMRVLGSYTRYFNDRHVMVGHLFQKPFGSRIASSDADLMGIIRYIHLNPVEAGLVPSPEQWTWSSHRGLLAGADPLIELERVRALFGGVDAYQEFLMKPPADRRPILTIAQMMFGPNLSAVLSLSRERAVVAQRRELVVAAMLEGHRPSALAKFLNLTPAAITSLVKRPTT